MRITSEGSWALWVLSSKRPHRIHRATVRLCAHRSPAAYSTPTSHCHLNGRAQIQRAITLICRRLLHEHQEAITHPILKRTRSDISRNASAQLRAQLHKSNPDPTSTRGSVLSTDFSTMTRRCCKVVIIFKDI